MRQHEFPALYHSSNIHEIRGKAYKTLVCAAPAAAKWRANQFPEQDRAGIENLVDNLSQVRVSEAILISTVDVYPVASGVDESFDCGTMPNHPYGANRFYLETKLRSIFPKLYIVRLPGLFGPGLKKNVIYDLINDNCLDVINPSSVFQYYDLTCLWGDLQTILEQELPLVNLATEPLATRTILDSFFPGKQVGQRAAPTATYNVQTRHAAAFGMQGQYRFNTAEVLGRLGRFISSYHLTAKQGDTRKGTA